MFDIQNFSNRFQIKELTKNDMDDVLIFCQNNTIYYHYHPVMLDKKQLLDDLFSLPPKTKRKDKYLVGFYEKETLIAILDLIDGYPFKDYAYIGFFMVNKEYQGLGIGSLLIEELIHYIKGQGYQAMRLAVDKGNPQSYTFWTKHHFQKTGEEVHDGIYTYYPMELYL